MSRRLVEPLPALLARDADRVELGLGHPAADADGVVPAVGDDVEVGDLVGQPNRIPPRRDRDEGAQADPLGASCEVGQRLNRVGRHAIWRAAVLGEPDAVEAERLGQVAQCERGPRHIVSPGWPAEC